MAQMQMLRLHVNALLTAATDEIFRLFATTIRQHEEEVLRLKWELDRQRRTLDTAEDRSRDTAEDRSRERAPAGRDT